MLKLKKLQILGFKSFCDRTELKFHGEGVAAIIGPNGCGKSNIADAISWVLGGAIPQDVAWFADGRRDFWGHTRPQTDRHGGGGADAGGSYGL